MMPQEPGGLPQPHMEEWAWPAGAGGFVLGGAADGDDGEFAAGLFAAAVGAGGFFVAGIDGGAVVEGGVAGVAVEFVHRHWGLLVGDCELELYTQRVKRWQGDTNI